MVSVLSLGFFVGIYGFLMGGSSMLTMRKHPYAVRLVLIGSVFGFAGTCLLNKGFQYCRAAPGRNEEHRCACCMVFWSSLSQRGATCHEPRWFNSCRYWNCASGNQNPVPEVKNVEYEFISRSHFLEVFPCIVVSHPPACCYSVRNEMASFVEYLSTVNKWYHRALGNALNLAGACNHCTQLAFINQYSSQHFWGSFWAKRYQSRRHSMYLISSHTLWVSVKAWLPEG